MNNDDQLTILGAELSAACTNYKPSLELEASAERDRILRKARQIMLAVSTPLHYTWTQVANMYALMSLRTVMQLGVLQQMPAMGKITVEQLARQSGVQASLLQRLLRVLVATQFIEQNGEGEYSHTRHSRAYSAVLGPGMMFQITYDDCFLGLGRFHQYLAERKSFTEPDDQSYNPFTWSRGQDGKTVWEIMAASGGLDIFQMALSTMDKKFPPTGFFDFASLLTADDDRDILVEVGGGIGRTLSAIINSSPELQKVSQKFVLQELEAPVKQAQKSGMLPKGTRVMVHNMFEEQPVKGARAYYLRRILHDYSDAKCIVILKHLAAAAAPDTLILVSEMMVPDIVGEGELPIVCMDMSMMNMGGKERSEKQFADILTAAGLELTKVWKGFGTDRLLEARLASPTDDGGAKANGPLLDCPSHDMVETNGHT